MHTAKYIFNILNLDVAVVRKNVYSISVRCDETLFLQVCDSNAGGWKRKIEQYTRDKAGGP